MKIPKRKADFEQALIQAFIAGCSHGYCVRHDVDMNEQEMIGALKYIGKISEEEYERRLMELWSK